MQPLKDFESKFSQLHDEEKQHAVATGKDLYLYASVIYKRPQSDDCLWKLGGGVNSYFRERFRSVATQAGIAVGCPRSKDSAGFWLNRLYRHLRENGETPESVSRIGRLYEIDNGHRHYLDSPESNTEYLLAATENAGVLLRVCAASANFCSRLEEQAPEQSEPSATQTHRLQKGGKHKNKSRNERQTVARKPALVVKTIAKLRKELGILQPQMYNESSYTKLQQKNPQYLAFKIANRYGEVRSWLERMQERRLGGLAQEIAALHHNVQKNTAKKYWSHRTKAS